MALLCVRQPEKMKQKTWRPRDEKRVISRHGFGIAQLTLKFTPPVSHRVVAQFHFSNIEV